MSDILSSSPSKATTVTMLDCPVELIEDIAGYLDVKDINSLRLTCRTLAVRASGGIWRTNLDNTSVRLSLTSLRRFERMLAKHEYGRYLKRLTVAMPLCWFSTDYLNDSSISPPPTQYIDGSWTNKNHTADDVYDRMLEDREGLSIPCNVLRKKQDDQYKQITSGALVKRLSHCFRRIKSRTVNAGLDCLPLTVLVDNGRVLHPLNQEVAECGKLSETCWKLFEVAMSALVTSKLNVTKLDLFSTTPYCSISCTKLIDWNEDAGSAHIFNNVKSLAISASRLTDRE